MKLQFWDKEYRLDFMIMNRIKVKSWKNTIINDSQHNNVLQFAHIQAFVTEVIIIELILCDDKIIFFLFLCLI